MTSKYKQNFLTSTDISMVVKNYVSHYRQWYILAVVTKKHIMQTIVYGFNT